MKRTFCGDCIFSAETDTHFLELTVAETLSFAAKAWTLPTTFGLNNEYVSNACNKILSIFHLAPAATTKIGDEVQRGISGGEKCRVNIAEALTGWSSLQCWDNSTRGMDSSTALIIMKVLRSFTTHQKATTIAILYQTSEPILNLFDKILLLYECQEIFFGPGSTAIDYFSRLGFDCPSKITIADFLTSLTNPTEAAQLVRSGIEHVPLTAENFGKAWSRSDERKGLLSRIVRFEEEHPITTPRDQNQW